MMKRVSLSKLVIFSMALAGMILAGIAQPGALSAAEEVQVHIGVGTVTKIDTSGSKITLSHGPIESMDWPAMKMAFSVKDKKHFQNLSEGKKVEFKFVQHGNEYIIRSIKQL